MKSQIHELHSKINTNVSKRSTSLLTNTINRSKKIAFTVAVLLTVCLSSFASNIGEVNGEVRASFHKDFQGAQIISSEARKNFNKVTFKMNNIVLFAFYSDNGELLAVTRNILSTQLPIGLQMSLKKDYNSSYWITELIEFNGEGQNAYYVTLENADIKLTLRSSGEDSWEVYEKTEKK